MRAIVVGILCFFPGFVFSLLITCAWARQHWTGEARARLGAIFPSFFIGVFTAIAALIYQLMKVSAQSR
jgi:hypothetical protein